MNAELVKLSVYVWVRCLVRCRPAEAAQTSATGCANTPKNVPTVPINRLARFQWVCLYFQLDLTAFVGTYLVRHDVGFGRTDLRLEYLIPGNGAFVVYRFSANTKVMSTDR